MYSLNISTIPLNTLLGEIQRRAEGPKNGGFTAPEFGGNYSHRPTMQKNWWQDNASLKTTYSDSLVDEFRRTTIRGMGVIEGLELWGRHASVITAPCDEAVTATVFNELVVLCYKLASKVDGLGKEVEYLKKDLADRKPKDLKVNKSQLNGEEK